MRRYCIELTNKGRTGKEAVIGYDKPLRTFFLHGFIPEDSDLDEPEIWPGAFLEEFPTLDRLSMRPAGRVARFAASSIRSLVRCSKRPARIPIRA